MYDGYLVMMVWTEDIILLVMVSLERAILWSNLGIGVILDMVYGEV